MLNSTMQNNLKEQLINIANNLTEDSTLEDIYDQLSLLNDIEVSEAQESYGDTLTQDEVEDKSKEWLK